MAEHVVPKTKTKTVTVQGIEVTVDPNLFDDLETFELLSRLNPADGTNPDVFAFFALVDKILGSQYKKVKDSLRDDEGRVPMDKMGDFIAELMTKIVPNS